MKKLAIIVHRAGTNIIGGAEDYAIRMAAFLAEKYSVDIITTTAKDHITWNNYYKSGIEKISKNINIFRFNVDIGRTDAWYKLNYAFFQNPPLRTSHLKVNFKKSIIQKIKDLPLGIQEEFIKIQGPYSKSLLNFIYENQKDYNALIFMTYLFAPTYFGVDLIKREKVFICPTFHDEPSAYLPIFRKYLRFKLLFLTEEEKNIAQKIWGESIPFSYIINFGLEDKNENILPIKDISNPYIIYAGRLEEGKGLPFLFEYFKKFSDENPSLNLNLFLLGDGPLKNIKYPKIKYLGIVDENQKLSLLKGAIAFVHPSPFESLSIALIESFMMGIPALVNKKSTVLFEHIQKSQAGFSFNSYNEFSSNLLKLIQDTKLRDNLSFNARKYFLNNYSAEIYKQRLFAIFESAMTSVQNLEQNLSIGEIYEEINKIKFPTDEIELIAEKYFCKEKDSIKVKIKQAIIESGLKYKKILLKIPLLGDFSKKIYHKLNPPPFFDISNWFDEDKALYNIISKEELLSLNKFDNDEFIRAAYQLILQREPDQTGFEIYKRILQKKGNKGKYHILKSIALSLEAKQRGIKVEIPKWEKLPYVLRNFLKF